MVEGFRSAGGLRYGVFQLNGTENMMEWTNLAKTMSANQDEEIWVEQTHYRDSKQRDELMELFLKCQCQEWDIWHIVLTQKITVSVFGRPTKAQNE